MPTVEDYFDDDTDIPLPSSSSRPRTLQGSGLQGALLEEISTDDPDVPELDYDRLAEQGRGVFGADRTGAPPPTSADKGKLVVRDDPGDLRPSGPGGMMNPNSPMGGFMGDMMRMQQVEEERLERMRKQFGNATVTTKDMEMYKGWNTVYPLYFDAKVSITDGRRVKREDSLWWPQAGQIAQACRALSLPSVLESDKTHPADWENPGRVKVQISQDGRFLNPIVKNRSQLYKQLSKMLQQMNPSVKYTAPKPKPATEAAAVATTTSRSKQSNSKSAKSTSQKGKSTKPAPYKIPHRPPLPTVVPPLDDRLPLHTPLVQTGVVISAVKRDLETDKENKKKGITSGAEEGGKDKAPKMKRVVVRGKR